MLKYISKRIILAFIALFVILFIVYVLVVLTGVNPNLVHAPDRATQAELITRARALGLDRNVIMRFFERFGKIFVGDFGREYNHMSSIGSTGDSIPVHFFESAKFTLLLTFPSFIISSILGTALGVFSGYKRGTYIDSAINLFALIFIAVPSFVFAPILIRAYTNAGLNPFFPTAPPDDPGFSNALNIAVSGPILILTLGSLAIYVNFMRNQTIFVLTSNQVLIAKAKGLSPRKIFFRHVFRNISIPLTSVLVPNFILLLSGSVILESIFGFNGSSRILVKALNEGEVDQIFFATFFFSSLALGSQIIVDVLIALIDPKIRFVEDSKRNLPQIMWLKVKHFYQNGKISKPKELHQMKPKPRVNLPQPKHLKKGVKDGN